MNWNSQVNMLRSNCAVFVAEISTLMGVVKAAHSTNVMPQVVKGCK